MDEKTKSRIRGLVEKSSSRRVCKICGYTRFTGKIHAFAGHYGPTRETTKFCTGHRVIYPKKDPGAQIEWQCPKCLTEIPLTELEVSYFESKGACELCSEST